MTSVITYQVLAECRILGQHMERIENPSWQITQAIRIESVTPDGFPLGKPVVFGEVLVISYEDYDAHEHLNKAGTDTGSAGKRLIKIISINQALTRLGYLPEWLETPTFNDL